MPNSAATGDPHFGFHVQRQHVGRPLPLLSDKCLKAGTAPLSLEMKLVFGRDRTISVTPEGFGAEAQWAQGSAKAPTWATAPLPLAGLKNVESQAPGTQGHPRIAAEDEPPVIDSNEDREGLAWQTGVWNRIADIYPREIDQRFAPVVEALIERAGLCSGEQVLDLGTGTGAVAKRAAAIVGASGCVLGVDISSEMLGLARHSAARLGLRNLKFLEGRAEAIPAEDAAFDVVLACLSMMYVIDRETAALQIARVLKPRGRFIAAVWAGPEQCDIVLFQQTAGRFAGPPPVPGVGPGALADTSGFLRQLDAAGVSAHVETELLGFDFPNFTLAWDTLAGVTAAQLAPERQREAKDAIMAAMYPDGDGPRHFRNATHFIVGRVSD